MGLHIPLDADGDTGTSCYRFRPDAVTTSSLIASGTASISADAVVENFHDGERAANHLRASTEQRITTARGHRT